MAAHRYWRLFVVGYERVGDTGTDLGYLRLYDSAGTNVALLANGTAISSTGTAANSFDENTNTFWSFPRSTPFPQWVGIDFGAATPRDIRGFNVYSWVGANHPGNSRIEYSDDGITWVPVFFFPAMSNPAGNLSLDFTSYVTTTFVDGEPMMTLEDRAAVSSIPATPPMTWAAFSSLSMHESRTSAPFANWWNGAYRIAGTVMADVNGDGIGDVNLRRRVFLQDEGSHITLEARWSDATTGAYSFDYLRSGLGVKYTVLAYDYQRNYRAVVADNLTPEVMP